MGDTCFEDPTIKGYLNKVHELTHVPIVNFNEMQILRYKPGQFYKTHGDYIVEDAHRRRGGRILTLFMYLNNVEEGGETRFRFEPSMQEIAIKPKAGSVVCFPPTWQYPHMGCTPISGPKYVISSYVQL